MCFTSKSQHRGCTVWVMKKNLLQQKCNTRETDNFQTLDEQVCISNERKFL